MRLAKQLRREIDESSDPDERKQLQADLHIAEVDEAYAVNFPHIEPYISLYRAPKSDDTEEAENAETSGETPSAREALKTERPPMWSTVEKAMQDGPSALRNLRERRSHTDESNAKRPPKATSFERQPATKPQRQPPQKQQPTNKQAASQPDGTKPQLNRRERRLLMHKNAADARKSDDEDGAGGFFED